MSYYILKDKLPIKASLKEFIKWNNSVDEKEKFVANFKLRNTKIITKFYGYKQAFRIRFSVFETQLLIDEEFIIVLAKSKERSKILAQHKKYVKILKNCDKEGMDFLLTVQGY